MKICKNASGFTLIELLVVLVIVGMASSMLVSGLSVSMQSLDRVANNYKTSQQQVALAMFRESIEGALLSHPEVSTFAGSESEINFVSSQPIDLSQIKPTKIQWQLQTNASPRGEQTRLVYRNLDTQQEIALLVMQGSFRFSYLADGREKSEFRPANGQLPARINIISNNDGVYATAAPIVPTKAIPPPEYLMFGAYEF